MSDREYRHNLQLCLTPTDKTKLLEIAEKFGCYPTNGRGKGPSISTLATRIAKGEILVRRVGKPTYRRDVCVESLNKHRYHSPKGIVFPRNSHGHIIGKGTLPPGDSQE